MYKLVIRKLDIMSDNRTVLATGAKTAFVDLFKSHKVRREEEVERPVPEFLDFLE